MTRFFTDKQKRIRPINSKRSATTFSKGTTHLSVPKRISDKPEKFKLKKDYGKVQLYTYKNRDYLIGEAYDETLDKNVKYAKRIADILDTMPKEDTKQITYVVIDPTYQHSGELMRGFLPNPFFEAMGDRSARIFVHKHEHYDGKTEKSTEYGIVFGSELWDENKNHLPHLVKHEVGHSVRYNLSEGKRNKIDSQYQKSAEQFLKIEDINIKNKIGHVDRNAHGEIWKIQDLVGINLTPELYEKYKIPSIYSMSQPSEYTAELYANGLLSDIK